MWHLSLVLRCVSTAVKLRGLRTSTIWHIYVTSMININDFAKGLQQVLIMEIQCLLCDVERNFHTQFGYILCFTRLDRGTIICFVDV